jgi:hypothetical protein
VGNLSFFLGKKSILSLRKCNIFRKKSRRLENELGTLNTEQGDFILRDPALDLAFGLSAARHTWKESGCVEASRLKL